MRLISILLPALFALSLIGLSFAQATNSTTDDPPPIPAGCFDDSDCQSGYSCVDDFCVQNGSSPGGGGGGGGGGDAPYGRDWEWGGWNNPNSTNGTQNVTPPANNSTGPQGNERPPSPPNDDTGGTRGVNAAADIPAQITQGIGDILSAMFGEIGRNPILIGIAAAIAVFVALLALIGGYAYFVRKK